MLYGRTGKENTLKLFSDTWPWKLHFTEWLRSSRPHTRQESIDTQDRNPTEWGQTSADSATKYVWNVAKRRQHRFWYTALEQQVCADASATKIPYSERPSQRQRPGTGSAIDAHKLKTSWVITTAAPKPAWKRSYKWMIQHTMQKGR